MSPALGMIELYQYNADPIQPGQRVFVAAHRIVSATEETRINRAGKHISVTVLTLENRQSYVVTATLERIRRLIAQARSQLPGGNDDCIAI